MEGIGIEIKYINTIDDYRLAHKLAMRLNKYFYIGYCILPKILTVTSILWGIKLIMEIIAKPYLIRYYYIYFIIICVVLLIIYKKDDLVFNKYLQKRIKSRIREITCTLEKDKLIYGYENTIIKILSKDIYDVMEENDTTYIISVHRTILLIVPNHAFKDTQQKNEFVNTIKGFES